MKVLKNNLNSKDVRVYKGIVAFLVVLGKSLHKSLEKEIKSQSVESFNTTYSNKIMRD